MTWALRYRGTPPQTVLSYSNFSPEEFVKYILDDLKRGYPNAHWKPQISSCPFCAIDFKIIGKLEDMTQDTFYILSIANLHRLINASLLLNPSSHLANDIRYVL